MFSQSQAYPFENQPEKRQIFLAFFISKKSQWCQKKTEFQNLASKSQIGNAATQ